MRRCSTWPSASTCSTSAVSDGALAEFERAVELVPAEPPSPERAYVLGSLAGGLMVDWRHAESLPIAEEALALAGRIGAREAEVRALTVLGGDLAYLGRGEEGLAHFRQARQLAEEIGDLLGLERAYGNSTDALTMLGRPRESARLARSGLEAMRRYGIESALLVSNQIEALLAIGDWDEADRLSAAALRRITASFPYWLLILRADVEIGRGEFDAARAHLEAASTTLREDRVLGLYDGYLADLAFWERRWTDADAAIAGGPGSSRASRGRADPRLALRQGTARPRRAGRARTRPPGRRRAPRPARPRAEAARPPRGAPPRKPRRSHPTPTAGARWPRPSTSAPAATARPSAWSGAADTWERLERPPLAAYCRWRQAEALVAAGAPRADATAPLREAHAVAARIGARPLLRELELLAAAGAARSAPPDAGSPDTRQGLEELLGLTPREAEVLTLVARGLTNREIAADARDQRQDRQRPRLAHPAQARRAEPARSGRNRPPTCPATYSSTSSTVDCAEQPATTLDLTRDRASSCIRKTAGARRCDSYPREATPTSPRRGAIAPRGGYCVNGPNGCRHNGGTEGPASLSIDAVIPPRCPLGRQRAVLSRDQLTRRFVDPVYATASAHCDSATPRVTVGTGRA